MRSAPWQRIVMTPWGLACQGAHPRHRAGALTSGWSRRPLSLVRPNYRPREEGVHMDAALA